VADPVVQIIVGSTRPGRVGLPVARWVFERAQAHGGFTPELVDLAEVALPLLDEPNHPRLQQYVHRHTLDWSATVSRADGFVFVIPEYNHSYSAAVKNALDYLHNEWHFKPAAFVSYGGVSAGTRSLNALKPVVTSLQMMPVFEAVNVPFVASFLDDDGAFAPNEVTEKATDAMFDATLRWIESMRVQRDR
jgi:NAD(P)H-dependent FMN reductase